MHNDPIHEAGDFYVVAAPGLYEVYRGFVTHAQLDSAYPQNDDGLSIAMARCDYLAKREAGHYGNLIHAH